MLLPGRNSAGSEQRDGEGGSQGHEDQRRAGGDRGGAGGNLLAAEVGHRPVRSLLHVGGLRVLAGVLPAVKKRTSIYTVSTQPVPNSLFNSVEIFWTVHGSIFLDQRALMQARIMRNGTGPHINADECMGPYD
jgi:hypothetical protein